MLYLRVGDEDQAGSAADDFVDGATLFVGQVAERAEDADAGHDAGAAVDGADEQRVAEHVVAEAVVAGEGHHRAEGDADRIKVLRRRVHPHLGLQQQLPLGLEQVGQPQLGSFQRQRSH